MAKNRCALPTQLSFFSQDKPAPKGFCYWPDFVSSETERDLLRHMEALPLEPFQFGAFEGKRQVAHFGFYYDYAERRLREVASIPQWLAPIIGRVETSAVLSPGSVRQVLCTEYDVGVGIGWHKDKPHFDKVFGLSLAVPCKFRFRRRLANGWERYTLDAEPRSLYMLADESRLVWEHSITPVEGRRYSITFRTMYADALPTSVNRRPTPSNG
jgi:alkylated DNA repair dioxygenase AlkB